MNNNYGKKKFGKDIQKNTTFLQGVIHKTNTAKPIYLCALPRQKSTMKPQTRKDDMFGFSHVSLMPKASKVQLQKKN